MQNILKDFTENDYNGLKKKIIALETELDLWKLDEIPNGDKFNVQVKPIIRLAHSKTDASIHLTKQLCGFLILDGYLVGSLTRFNFEGISVSEFEVSKMDNSFSDVPTEYPIILIHVPD